MLRIGLILLLFQTFFITVFSQQNDSIFNLVKTENYIRIQYDNDFFSATDRYYTQGIQLDFTHPIVKYSPFTYTLFSLKKTSKKYYGIQFHQDCFTPLSIRYDTLNYRERPYAATFFISHTLNSLNKEKKMAIQTQVDLGIIGPCAKCEDEQKAIHRALLNIQPLGWGNQLQTDYIINYRIKVEKGLYSKKNREINAQTQLRVGTLYTDINAGITARMGFFSPYFSNLGMDIKGIHRKRNFQFYGILRGNAKAVGYNATLQGGVFNNNNRYEINTNRITRFVFDGMAGIVLTYKKISLEYDKFYLSKEFTEGLDHGWGRCLISVSF